MLFKHIEKKKNLSVSNPSKNGFVEFDYNMMVPNEINRFCNQIIADIRHAAAKKKKETVLQKKVLTFHFQLKVKPTCDQFIRT